MAENCADQVTKSVIQAPPGLGSVPTPQSSILALVRLLAQAAAHEAVETHSFTIAAKEAAPDAPADSGKVV
jgi:hypothetical protein